MSQIKSALETLEKAVYRLEEAVYVHKKNASQAGDKIHELRQVIYTAYSRLDKALGSLKKGDK